MKNRIMGILALASCVVLSGCGDKEEAKIVISELPTNLVEGNQIDLKDYITVSGGTGGYSINFDDESFAKITQESETLITLDDMGNINFTVDYSGKTQEGTLVVGSKLLNDFVGGIKNAGYDYHNLYFEYDDYMNEIGMHWENYSEKVYIDSYMDFESEDYNYISGYVQAGDDAIYSFDEIHDGDDVDFDFSLTGNEPTDMSEVSSEIDTLFPTSGYSVREDVNEETGESFKFLRFDENENGDVKRIFQDFFLLNTDVIEQYGYEITAFEVVEDQFIFDEELTLNVYGVYGMVFDSEEEEEGILWDGFLSFDKDVFIKNNIQKFADEGKIPESKYKVNVDAIADAISDHNYQIDFSANWYKCSVSKDGTQLIRGEVVEENPFVTDWDKDSYYINDHFNAKGNFKAYVTPTKIFVDVPNDNSYGLAENPNDSNHAWDYAYDPVSNTYKTEDQDTADTGYGLFHDANLLTFYNFEFLSGKPLDASGTNVYDSMFINSMEEGENTVTYKMLSKTCLPLFSGLFYYSIYDGEIPADDDWKPSSFTNFSSVASFIFGVELEGGLLLSDLFDVTIVEKYSVDGEELIGLNFEFAWLGVEQTTSGYVYYQYVLAANIDFENCDMPVFDVNFAPVVE